MHRHQFNRVHAERGQVPDDARRRERRKFASNPARRFGMQRGHPLHVRLVDDEILPRNCGLAIAIPVVRRIDHHALGHRGRAVAQIQTRRSVDRGRAITDHRIVPSRRAIERARIRIEQQLGGVEAMSCRGIVGTADAIAIPLTGPNAAKINVPDVFGALDQRYSRDLVVTNGTAKQAQHRAGRVLGKYRKVHTRAVTGSAKRIRHAGQNFKFGLWHFEIDTNGKPYRWWQPLRLYRPIALLSGRLQMRSVDLYFDFSSTNSYFAAFLLPEVCARNDARVSWMPTHFAALFRGTGFDVMAMTPRKARYLWRDHERYAQWTGLPFKRPRRSPIKTASALRAVLAAGYTAQPDDDGALRDRAKGAISQAIMRAYWERDEDIGDREVLASIASSAGFDGARLMEI